METVEAERVSAQSAQKTELVAVIRALELSADKKVTLYLFRSYMYLFTC